MEVPESVLARPKDDKGHPPPCPAQRPGTSSGEKERRPESIPTSLPPPRPQGGERGSALPFLSAVQAVQSTPSSSADPASLPFEILLDGHPRETTTYPTVPSSRSTAVSPTIPTNKSTITRHPPPLPSIGATPHPTTPTSSTIPVVSTARSVRDQPSPAPPPNSTPPHLHTPLAQPSIPKTHPQTDKHALAVRKKIMQYIEHPFDNPPSTFLANIEQIRAFTLKQLIYILKRLKDDHLCHKLRKASKEGRVEQLCECLHINYIPLPPNTTSRVTKRRKMDFIYTDLDPATPYLPSSTIAPSDPRPLISFPPNYPKDKARDAPTAARTVATERSNALGLPLSAVNAKGKASFPASKLPPDPTILIERIRNLLPPQYHFESAIHLIPVQHGSRKEAFILTVRPELITEAGGHHEEVGGSTRLWACALGGKGNSTRSKLNFPISILFGENGISFEPGMKKQDLQIADLTPQLSHMWTKPYPPASPCITFTVTSNSADFFSGGCIALCFIHRRPIEASIRGVLRHTLGPHRVGPLDGRSIKEMLALLDTLPPSAAAMKQEDQDGIEMGDERVSFKCPLSLLRMEYPGKGRACLHRQCFDLKNFLVMNELYSQPKCPVCRTVLPFANLVLDSEYRRYLILFPKDNECIIKADGTVVAVDEGSKSGQSSDHRIAPVSPASGPSSGKAPPKTRDSAVIILDDDDDEEEEEDGVVIPATPVAITRTRTHTPPPKDPSIRRTISLNGPTTIVHANEVLNFYEDDYELPEYFAGDISSSISSAPSSPIPPPGQATRPSGNSWEDAIALD